LDTSATVPPPVGEVEVRLLVLREAGVEAPAPLVASISAHDREPTGEPRGAAGGRPAERRLHRPVQPTATLKQEAAIPVLRHRESEAMP
jgi:hypothetical protein